MKHTEINDLSRKLLPVVVGLLVFLLVVYFWIVSVRLVPRIADSFFPAISDQVPTYGDVGEMFGAVSSFFSIMAVFLVILLFWRQRNDQQKQQGELLKMKADYEVNRLNNVIISQVNRIEYLVETLIFQDLDDSEFEGMYGIDFLNASFKTQNISKYKQGHGVGLAEEELILHNYKNIKRLLLAIAQCSQTIEDQISISHIDWVEKERLYAIYLRNLGASILVLLRKLESFTDVVISSENSYQNTNDTFDNPIFVLSELSAGFFHNIASNCDSTLIERIVPEPIL